MPDRTPSQGLDDAPRRPSAAGIADLNPHVGVRRRRAVIRRARRIAVAVLIVAAVASLAWLVFGSSVLTALRVEVRGTAVVTTDQVTTAAQVPLGTPLARVNTGAVSRRVAALPEVARVSVARVWPHTLRITVTERKASFQRDVTTAEGTTYQWVGADGAVFHTDATRLDVPLLHSPTDDATLLADVATVVGRLPAELVPQTHQITAASRDQITLALDDGRQVVWGSADESELKASVIVVLLRQPGTVYDVSAPGHPAVR